MPRCRATSWARGDWLRSIWDDRAAFADKPALLLWGLKDIAFRRKELERWKSALPDFELHEFEDCGHFLAEEAPDRVVSALRDFIGRNGTCGLRAGRLTWPRRRRMRFRPIVDVAGGQRHDVGPAVLGFPPAASQRRR